MAHVGDLLKDAIINSGYTLREVSARLRKSRNTVQRWVSTPNIGLREVREIQEAFPDIYLGEVYQGLEVNLGYELPNNPYRTVQEPSKRESEHRENGIRVLIDAERYAGFRIPIDFIDRVRVVLESAQSEYTQQPPTKSDPLPPTPNKPARSKKGPTRKRD